MLTLYYAPGACSMAAHIVLEETGEKYQPQKVDLAGGEQRTEGYLKINPQGRVPALKLDDGEPLAENTAILPYLGKRFGLWPSDAVAEAKALSLIGFFAASVHPRARPCRPARALRRRPVCLPHAEGNGAQNLPQLSEADRRQISRARMVRRQILRGRSLRLRVLYLGRAARAADGRAQELHGVQGSHAQARGGQTRRRRREGQGLSGGSAAARVNTVGRIVLSM